MTRANTAFRPEDSITLAESAAILMKALDMKLSQSEKHGTFTPGTTSWQKPYIITLFEHGIISSTESFFPNIVASRGQVFSLAARIHQTLQPNYVRFSGQTKVSPGAFLKKKPDAYNRVTNKKTPTYLKYKKDRKTYEKNG